MPDNLRLNIASMDEKHDDFLALLDKIRSCGNAEFLPLFNEMVEHTQEHFAFEEDMMHTYNFYARQEHLDEHANLLGEMKYFYEKSKRMPMIGRSYINDYAYEKFKRHVTNIDSQLAMFLKEHGLRQEK
ncbi:hemerythrin family protein [Sulfurimonas sp. HSL3-7]|uniref:bacteriohemerythrin n=1 Tax=Sulfonitrofixus jiaomeiensis TaxID=3131938 RepID=UPI0031FA1375